MIRLEGQKIAWKRIAKAVVFIAIIVYILTSVCLYANTAESRICISHKVVIADSATLRFVTPEEVVGIIEKEGMNPRGIRLEYINLQKIEDMLERQPRIKNAECFFSPNGRLNITVTQCEPILRVMSQGKNFYVDKDGKSMGISDDFAAYVPIVTGQASVGFSKNELYKFALFLHNNKFWNALIEQIDVEKTGPNNAPEITLVSRIGNQVIKLGSLNDFEKKLNKLNVIYKKGFNKIGWNYYKVIDLRYDKQVVCTHK